MDPQQLRDMKRALGRRLAELRTRRGLTQDDLGRLVHSNRSTVGNVEVGRQVSDRVFWVQCESLLKAGGELISGYDEYRAGEIQHREEKAEAARHARWGAVLDHRTITEASSPIRTRGGDEPPALPAGSSPAAANLVAMIDEVDDLRRSLNATLTPGPINDAGLDEWGKIVTRHGRATRDRSTGALLRDIADDLIELKELISRRPSASALRCLTGMAAQMSGLLCLVLCRIDDKASALRWARTGRLAAVEAGNPMIQAWVLAQEAHAHYYSADFHDAVEAARHAQEIAGHKASAGTALAAAIEARTHAATGRRKQTRAALGRAEDCLSRLEGEALSASAFGYSEAQLRFHEENAYTRLGDVSAALAAQERALQLCSPGDYTDWALTRLDRATCLTTTGDASDALDTLTETIGSLEGPKRQGIIADRARRVLDALPPTQRSSSTAQDIRALLIQPQ
ncbi:helix-turn-helix domain-containing protein [Salinispora pacifica]|uniref:helix-turn-helix domain-containing protein n=1 Tax=Salinispora pacifica TaxID=351187 RepID=UPI00048832C3|nr:helix-turn-helix transcriptional regulator [Salinispora pacifica]